jgi:hypothetical protein
MTLNIRKIKLKNFLIKKRQRRWRELGDKISRPDTNGKLLGKWLEWQFYSFELFFILLYGALENGFLYSAVL